MPNESYEDIAEAEDAIDFFSGCVEKDQLPYVLAVVSKQTGELIGDTGINEEFGAEDDPYGNGMLVYAFKK